MSTNAKRLALVLLIAGLAACWFAFDLGEVFTLEALRASRGRLEAAYAAHRLLFIAGYFALYVVVTALSLPAATLLGLLGGALFGLPLALVVVSFASTIGATLACAASRFLLRDWVRARVGSRMEVINRGIEREGAFYLFSLRLIPVVPFFVINLGMGLTPMRLSTFYWVSQLGMLPGTAVYVNAGSELGEVTSLSGILSPGLVISFVLLGLFPWAAKFALARLRRLRGQ
jgi:uncharacterized membrane protein YdjX (TVP38/TMEM64 family)